jgi:hypothetical protein
MERPERIQPNLDSVRSRVSIDDNRPQQLRPDDDAMRVPPRDIMHLPPTDFSCRPLAPFLVLRLIRLTELSIRQLRII